MEIQPNAKPSLSTRRPAMPSIPDICPKNTSRRRMLRSSLGLAAVLPAGLFLPSLVSAQEPSSPAIPLPGIITRTIPSTGASVPAIGLGTFLTFDTIPGQPRDHLGDVIRIYWEGGARLVDTSPLYGTAEITVGDVAASLGIADQLFIANKIWSTGDFLADESHALESLTLSEGRLWRQPIDLMQCHSLVNVDVVVPYLRAWKKEGRIHYTGVTHFENVYHPALLSWVERGNLDVVQVNYSIFNRAAEQWILPTAVERGIAVLTNMPFEKARLFKVVEGQEVPDFARDAGIDSWAQFFLSWVISHPAVTCALPATSDPAHAAENITCLHGPLPDPDLRQQMVRHMETMPGFQQIAQMPWYPGKRYPGIIGRAQAELRARS
jgi:diketogulonate reductase-like aldo/keto reductase